MNSVASEVERRMIEASRGPYDVFLSHSSKDKPWADMACAVSEREKIRCWIAPRDIRPGNDWDEEIIDGIDACRIMVLILSEHANASKHVRHEVQLVPCHR